MNYLDRKVGQRMCSEFPGLPSAVSDSDSFEKTWPKKKKKPSWLINLHQLQGRILFSHTCFCILHLKKKSAIYIYINKCCNLYMTQPKNKKYHKHSINIVQKYQMHKCI